MTTRSLDMEPSVEEYVRQVKRFSNYCIVSIVVLFLAWWFSPYAEFFAAALLGTFIGFINWLHTAYKVHKIGQAVIRSERPPGAGVLTRLGFGALAAVIVVSYPQFFDILGLAVGLILPTIVVILDGIYMHLFSVRKE
jgi:ATP synthase protein I